MKPHMQRKLEPINLPAGTRVGSWSIIGRLGWGGYGVVYLVNHVRKPRRQAALKLALQPGPAALRLEREVEMLTRVRHPNVVHLIEAGHWQIPTTQVSLPFLIMEYVPGADLYTWVSEHNPLLHEMLKLFKQSALAAHALHQAGVFHRDMKGENLIVHEGDGRLVLVDLGVGTYEGATTLTCTPLPPGTRAYRSPEALRFQQAHHSSFESHYEFRTADELYAMGITWYRAFTDDFPFEIEGPEGAWRSRSEGHQPVPPAVLNPRVPPGVSDLLLRLLSPRPEERPASALEVAKAVDALLLGKDRALKARIFEWYDGPSALSRTTDDGGAQDMNHEELLRLAMRQSDMRDMRMRRRRPRELVPRTEALGSLVRQWLPGHRSTFVLGGVLVTVFASGLTIGLRRAPPIEGIQVRPPSESIHPIQEDRPMHETKAPVGSLSVPEAAPSTQELEFMKSLAAAMCLVTASCAGVPTKTTWPQDCPPETIAAMKQMGFEPGDQAYIRLDINQPGGLSEFGVYRAGPIVSVFSEDDLSRLLPEGTKVYGTLWTGTQDTHVYWTRAELPDGREVPLCAVLGYNERGGYPMEAGAEPGTVIVSKQAPLTVTRRFERPE